MEGFRKDDSAPDVWGGGYTLYLRVQKLLFCRAWPGFKKAVFVDGSLSASSDSIRL